MALVPHPFGLGQNPMMPLGKQTVSKIFKQVADNTLGCMNINKAIFRERFEAAGRGY